MHIRTYILSSTTAAATPKIDPALANRAGALVKAMMSGVSLDTSEESRGADMLQRSEDFRRLGGAEYLHDICENNKLIFIGGLVTARIPSVVTEQQAKICTATKSMFIRTPRHGSPEAVTDITFPCRDTVGPFPSLSAVRTLESAPLNRRRVYPHAERTKMPCNRSYVTQKRPTR
jgi:hypothetical protein